MFGGLLRGAYALPPTAKAGGLPRCILCDDAWTWELAARAQDDLDALAPENQDRIIDKLDEVVNSPWRDPPDYGEPLQNSPYKKIRVGVFRLSVSFRQDERRLVVARIKRRDGAYTADDD